MPTPTDITAGTISISGTTVTGVGTGFAASDIRQGDLFIWIEGGDGFQAPIVASVESNTSLTLEEPWEGPTLTGVRYRIRYQWDSSRVSAQSRQLIELLDNGNVLALTGLTGPGVPVFDGPHSMVIRPEAGFVNGVAYDVQVDTLADRDAYDGQSVGFAVLVSDVGDGRAALYSKNSNTSGDWSDPAYITGGIGNTPDIEATVTNSAPGTPPTVTPVPITGGTRLDFVLPEASGFYNAGVYDIGEAYTTDQVVRFNGSSFIALQAAPVGESPSSASPPIDTAYWQVLAAKGADGSGTGDVMGPSGGVTDGDLVAFDGTTGKIIKRAVGVYTRSNILGTVSQVSGVPTGAIIEQGSNANGFYVRYADGTQICRHTFNLASLAIDVPFSGGGFVSANQSINFPATFIAAPSATMAGGGDCLGALAAPGTTALVYALCSTASLSAGARNNIAYLAIGRWF